MHLEKSVSEYYTSSHTYDRTNFTDLRTPNYEKNLQGAMGFCTTMMVLKQNQAESATILLI